MKGDGGMPAEIREIREAFFAAMTEGGWAATENSERKSIKLGPGVIMPGFSGIEWKDGPWIVTDAWIQIPGSPWSGGITTIVHRGVPVWLMQYRGWYADGVLKFLRQALMVNYEQSRFLGGRGPGQYCEGHLSYSNETIRNDFADFAGREKVFDRYTKEPLGYHVYGGLLLFSQ